MPGFETFINKIAPVNLGIWPRFLKYPKRNWAQFTVILFMLGWMAFYPVYCSYYKANGVDHYRRHIAHINGNSMFFNPWQYRILCPLVIEGMYWVADHTVFEVVEINGIDLGIPANSGDKNNVTAILINSLKNPEFVKYTIVFLTFRFTQNILLLMICFYYFSLFVKNKLLVILGLMVATLFMGNSVVDSDLTFNTYMDISLYIIAGIVIVKKLNPWWIVLLTLLGVLNRETALFIPVIYFFSTISLGNFSTISGFLKNNAIVLLITSISVVLFIAIFISIRMYYGLQPVSTWRVSAGWPMLKLNLFSSVSLKTYMEIFGVFGILPVWCILIYSDLSKYLKLFFLVLVPVWFLLHFSTAIAYQTRLFLVPTLLVFLPSVLEYLDKSYDNHKIEHQKATLT